MKYSKEFLEKAKKAYPGWTELHSRIRGGYPLVEDYLRTASKEGVPPEIIIEKLNAGQHAELKELAEIAIAKKELYQECWLLNQGKREKNESNFIYK